ncbi:hypothetical protein O181_067219 [Austropuccinia psidii MF-1]|uniref:Uncharacterized protein n=1 Tax=Austropuccinia psidii MF-1 TaxID=1389203 RepID=A0A9Q3EUH3_9BASI|nr:hypothetical protein [Austropuccinia psidii MF-1]
MSFSRISPDFSINPVCFVLPIRHISPLYNQVIPKVSPPLLQNTSAGIGQPQPNSNFTTSQSSTTYQKKKMALNPFHLLAQERDSAVLHITPTRIPQKTSPG